MTQFTNTTLNYPQSANTPIRRTEAKTDPTSSNWQNFIPGDEWWNKLTNRYWKMVDNKPGNALWIELAGSGAAAQTLEGNSGGPVGVNSSHNIFVQGDGTTIDIAGNPGTNTLTVSAIPPTTAGFLAYTAADINNVTGIDSRFTFNPTLVLPDVIYNDGGVYNTSTGEFTAPVTGEYFFAASVLFINLGANNLHGNIYISSPSALITSGNIGFNKVYNDLNQCSALVSGVLSLTAGDVAYIRVGIGQNVSNNVGVAGFGPSNAINSYFCGHLLTTISGGGGTSGVFSLEGSSGGIVGPDVSGNIVIEGDGTTITSVGNPATNTITTSLISPVSPSNGGTGVVSPALHSLPVAQGSSSFNFVGPLTDGQLLIGNSSGDPIPSTLTAGTGVSILNSSGAITISAPGATGGDLILVSTQNFSGADLIFSSIGSYQNYFLLFSNMLNSVNSAYLRLRFSTDNGVSFITSGYQSGVNTVGWNSNIFANSSDTTSIYVVKTPSASSPLIFTGSALLSGMNISTSPGLTGSFQGQNVLGLSMGAKIAPITANAFSLGSTSGSFTQGKVSLYGYVQ